LQAFLAESGKDANQLVNLGFNQMYIAQAGFRNQVAGLLINHK